jgi:hypothetical protein
VRKYGFHISPKYPLFVRTENRINGENSPYIPIGVREAKHIK